MSPRGMVDAFAPATCDAAFQSDELIFELGYVEQIDRLGVQTREQVEIKLAPVHVREVVLDAPLAELLTRPLASVAVALNTPDSIQVERLVAKS